MHIVLAKKPYLNIAEIKWGMEAGYLVTKREVMSSRCLAVVSVLNGDKMLAIVQ